MTSSIPILTLEAQIKRRLRHHLKRLGFQKDDSGMLCPPLPEKGLLRSMHASQRAERHESQRRFIEREWPQLRCHFADGRDVNPSKMRPRLEMIEGGSWQSDLFRLASLTWSVPVSEGYGRRMRFLIWDDNNEKLVGILALGDPVFNLQVRDNLIGWNAKGRMERLVHALDAFVLGAVPPYNTLLGTKLIASLVRTREVVDSFAARYAHSQGLISGRCKKPELLMVTTCSALGRSSVYNRLKLNGNWVFEPIGYTGGWGHFHVPDDLFELMRQYLSKSGQSYAANNRYGDGPNWKFRAIRHALGSLGLNRDLLRHGIQREVFACFLARNAKAILAGGRAPSDRSDLLTVDGMSDLAIERWVKPRAKRFPDYRLWSCDQIRSLFLSVGSSLNEAPQSRENAMARKRYV